MGTVGIRMPILPIVICFHVGTSNMGNLSWAVAHILTKFINDFLSVTDFAKPLATTSEFSFSFWLILFLPNDFEERNMLEEGCSRTFSHESLRLKV